MISGVTMLLANFLDFIQSITLTPNYLQEYKLYLRSSHLQAIPVQIITQQRQLLEAFLGYVKKQPMRRLYKADSIQVILFKQLPYLLIQL